MSRNYINTLQPLIDNLKGKLYKAIELNAGNIQHPSVIELSQQLDVLIVQSYK